MDVNWIAGYKKVSDNAFTADWYVSPLEYSWPNGKKIADGAFRAPSTPSEQFDRIHSPHLFLEAMKADFRAKMMVYAFMREPIAKTYALEIESGLMSLYRLDFLSCISQWMPVIEGYCRQLFKVANLNNVKSSSWTIPSSGIAIIDASISVVRDVLGRFLDENLYKGTKDSQTTKLNRHLMLHGNLQNNHFFSQKNCLLLLFILDSLVFIELLANMHFPVVFQDELEDPGRIDRRKAIYFFELNHALSDRNIAKLRLLDEHV